MMGNFWHREKTTCAVLLTLTGTLWILPIVRMETCNPSLKVRPVVSITSSPKNNRLRIGASMNLTCTAQPRDADSVHLHRWVDYIEWYDPQGRHVGAKCKQPSNAHAHRPKLSCPLLLKNLTVDSLGFYTCQAGNGYAKHCTRKSVRITVDGGWSEWNSWSICTKPVGGIQTRERECTNPEPAFLGKHCDGNRAQLRECSNTSSCHEAFPLRFKTEKNPSLGRMEIYTNSSWQKLCTSQWDEADLNLTCMAMGYYNNGVYINDTRYAKRCNASKKSNYHNCTTPTTCQKNLAKKHQFCKVPVRLNGANMEYGGRVEVFYKGKWVKICRNGWDFDDVKVICRQLGFEEALAVFIGSDVKDEGIPFAMSDVSCNGDEPELAYCARIDGKVKISPQCLSDDKGSQALCQPKNKKVLDKKELYFDIGSNEELQCSIHNETSYTGWAINGVTLNTSSTSQRIRIKETGELFIDKVQLSDAGLYECYRLKYVRYYIVYINARFTEDTLDQQTLIAGEPGTIRCSAEGSPSPQIYWSKKGGKSLSYRRFTQLSNGNLHIRPVQPEDSGTFICTMKQIKGPKRVTSINKNIIVTVMARPKVNISGASNLIIEGNSVNLTCEIVAGRPEPEITWFKSNTLLRKSWSLLFPKIKKSDEGQYTCRAENDAGNDTKHVNISVKVPPRIKLEFKNVNIELHSAFSTKCNWSGDPEVHVNWTKDGVLLSTNSTLVIRRATFKDKGNYECTAQNDYGKAKASIWIDVTAEQVPRAIQGSNSLWYYIGGLVAVVIVISLIACFFCKRRRTVLIKSRQFKERTIQMEPLNVEVNEWEIEMSRVEGPSEPCGELF